MRGGKNRIEETGNRYGCLTVIGPYTGKTKWSNAIWLCRCDCGVEIAVRGDYLRKGRTSSCGCMRGELQRASMRRYWAERKRREAEYGA